MGWALGAVVAVAVLVGTVLRFMADSPMWLDEALTANISELPPDELLDALRSDGHPPLYYLLAHVWGGLFGTSDMTLRALSGVLSVAALPLLWVAARRRIGPVGAWVAVAVLAMSPFAVRYGSEFRMYALVMLEVLVVWLLVGDLWAGRRPQWRAPLLAVAAGALLWTHYWGMFLLGAIGVVALLRMWRPSLGTSEHDWGGGVPAAADSATVRRGSWWVIGSLVVGGVIFLPWVPSFLQQLATTGTPWAEATRPTAALGLFLADLGGGIPPESYVAAGVIVVLVVFGVFGRPGRRPEDIELTARSVPTVRWEAVVAAVAFAAGVGAGFAGGTAFATRYASVVVPLVAIVVAAGVVVVRRPSIRAGLLAGLCVLGAAGILNELGSDRSQSGVIAESIAADVQPGDVVAFCPDQLGPAGERSLRQALGVDGLDEQGIRAITLPGGGDPRLVDWVDYAERNAAATPGSEVDAIAAAAGDTGTVYLVWNPAYRTYEGFCEAVVDGLAAQFPSVVQLVDAAPKDFYEHAVLTRFARR